MKITKLSVVTAILPLPGTTAESSILESTSLLKFRANISAIN